MASGQECKLAKIAVIGLIIFVFLFSQLSMHSFDIAPIQRPSIIELNQSQIFLPTPAPSLAAQPTMSSSFALTPTLIPRLPLLPTYRPPDPPSSPLPSPSPTIQPSADPTPTTTPSTTPLPTILLPTITPTPRPNPTPISTPLPQPTSTPIPTPQRIKGVSVNWCFYDDPSTETISHILAGWQSQIPWMKQLGFNSVRLMIAPPQSQAVTIHVYNLADLTSVINFLGSNGFTVTLDCHNWQGDMQPTAFGSAAWHNFWMQVSAQCKDNSYVVAYELMNEPYPADCTPDMTSWQSIQAAYGWLIHDIRSTGDNKAIILTDPQFWQPPTANNDIGDPGAWAAGKQSLPYLTNVIVTTHNGPYTAETAGGLSYDDYFNYYAQRLYDWRNVAPVINGEISFRNNTPDEIVWVRNWIAFLDQVNIGYYIFMSGSTYQYALSQKSINQVFGITS